jgi:hypothetical protein
MFPTILFFFFSFFKHIHTYELCAYRITTISLEILAAIFGLGVLLLLIDQTFTYLHLSLFIHRLTQRYHDDKEKPTEPNPITKQHNPTTTPLHLRKYFKLLIMIFVFLHGALQFIAMCLLFDLQRNRIKWPTGLDFHYGIFLQGISWVCGILFLVLFWWVERRTFFVDVDVERDSFDNDDDDIVVVVDDEERGVVGSGRLVSDVEAGQVEEQDSGRENWKGGHGGRNSRRNSPRVGSFSATTAPVAMVGDHSVDVIAARIIRGEDGMGNEVMGSRTES